MKRLNGWERIAVLVGVVGGLAAGYFADRFSSFPEEPSLKSEWELRFRSEYETLNLLAYMLSGSEIDESLAEERQRREAICASTSISLAERQRACGLGVVRPGILNWNKIEENLRNIESYNASVEIGFRDEHGSSLTPNRAVEKAKTLRPDLAGRIDQFYSIRSMALENEISDRNKSERKYTLSVMKYYGVVLLWAAIPGICIYAFMVCFLWVRTGFSKS